jgi:hypothetical protein
MKLRYLTACVSGMAVFATGASLLWAQQAQDPARQSPNRTERQKLRAEVIKLRTEVEMLRFDYDLARDGALEEIKLARGLKTAGGIMASVTTLQAALIAAGSQEPGAPPLAKTGDRALPVPPPPQETEQDRNKAAEAAKAAEIEEKKEAAEEAALVAKVKEILSQRYTQLSEKQLDLEDAERKYRESSH